MPLRQLGVYLSLAGPCQGRQATLFSDDRYDKLARVDRAVDGIRDHFGEQAIIRACFLQPDSLPLSDRLATERHYGLTKPLPED